MRNVSTAIFPLQPVGASRIGPAAWAVLATTAADWGLKRYRPDTGRVAGGRLPRALLQPPRVGKLRLPTMTAAALGKQACPPYREAHRANQPQEMERNAQTSATKKRAE